MEIYHIPQDVKDNVVRQYVHDRKTHRVIAKTNGISVLQVIGILQEYVDKTNQRELKRNQKMDMSLYDEEIYKLRKQGWTFVKIREALENKGIIMSTKAISNRAKIIFREKGEEDNIGDIQLKNMILNLMETRSASEDQIKRIAKFYGINMDDKSSQER